MKKILIFPRFKGGGLFSEFTSSAPWLRQRLVDVEEKSAPKNRLNFSLPSVYMNNSEIFLNIWKGFRTKPQPAAAIFVKYFTIIHSIIGWREGEGATVLSYPPSGKKFLATPLIPYYIKHVKLRMWSSSMWCINSYIFLKCRPHFSVGALVLGNWQMLLSISTWLAF